MTEDILKIPRTRVEAFKVLNILLKKLGLQELSDAANAQEIKKAYHKLALIYYPDKLLSPEENNRFKLLGEKQKRGEGLNEQEESELKELAKKIEKFLIVKEAYTILKDNISEEFVDRQARGDWGCGSYAFKEYSSYTSEQKQKKQKEKEKFKQNHCQNLKQEEVDLFYALWFKNLEETKKSLEKVNNLNIKLNNGKAPIHYIVEYACIIRSQDWVDLLEKVLQKYTTVCINDTYLNSLSLRCSSLHLALAHHCYDVAEMLLEHRADATLINHGSPPLRCVLLYKDRDNREILEQLFAHGAKIDSTVERAIIYGIDSYDRETIMILLEHASDKQKNNMLQHIVCRDNIDDRAIDTVKILLERDADPHYRDNSAKNATRTSALEWVKRSNNCRLKRLFTHDKSVSNKTNNNLHQKQQDNQPPVTKQNPQQNHFPGISPRGCALIATCAIVGGVIGVVLVTVGIIPAIAAIGIIATAVLAGAIGVIAGGAIGYLTDVTMNKCCSGPAVGTV